MTGQLGLFAPAAPAPAVEPPTPEPPDPWTWRRDYLETDWDEGLRGFLCQPEPGLIASVRTEGQGWVWELAYGDKIVSNGGAMTMVGAQTASRREVERLKIMDKGQTEAFEAAFWELVNFDASFKERLEAAHSLSAAFGRTDLNDKLKALVEEEQNPEWTPGGDGE